MSEEQLNRTVRRLAWWPLLRAVVPLIAVSLSMTAVYVWLGLTTDQQQVFYGVPLLVAGGACALVGLRTRRRDLDRTDDPTTHGYGLVFLGWALVVVGLVLPWYVVS